VPIGQYKNNVTVETCIFLHPGGCVTLSILGDTADFGRIKKRTFSTIALLKPQEIEPGGCAFQLQTTICERGLYLGLMKDDPTMECSTICYGTAATTLPL
jgi:hypothetical protein